MTAGYDLPAKYVIHTVGPVWHGGTQGEPERLAACYRHSIELAARQGVSSLAFPGISTGVYGYPVREAATIAVTTVAALLDKHPSLRTIIFCCFSDSDLAVYASLLDARKLALSAD